MSNKSLKQMLADQKRKKAKVKKLDAELRAEKALVAKLDKAIVAKRASDKKKKAPAKRTAPKKK